MVNEREVYYPLDPAVPSQEVSGSVWIHIGMDMMGI